MGCWGPRVYCISMNAPKHLSISRLVEFLARRIRLMLNTFISEGNSLWVQDLIIYKMDYFVMDPAGTFR